MLIRLINLESFDHWESKWKSYTKWKILKKNICICLYIIILKYVDTLDIVLMKGKGKWTV